jgi:Sodium/hydrogen exchanger family
MVSRGEVGVIVAGVGMSAGALSSDIYTAVIIMVALTTIITPIWLKRSYMKDNNMMSLHSSNYYNYITCRSKNCEISGNCACSSKHHPFIYIIT